MMSGEKFGRLTVIAEASPRRIPSGARIYRVVAGCDCGSELVVYEHKLRSGQTQSCGCLQIERSIENLPKPTHGMARHGKGGRSPTYLSWQAMHYRCKNPKCSGYERYGGAGITVCERWQSFEVFLADMGERPAGMTLDRKNSAGNYEPENCKWSPWHEQEGNRRNNVFVVMFGERIHTAEAARRLGLKDYAFRRLAKKMGGYQFAVDHLNALTQLNELAAEHVRVT